MGVAKYLYENWKQDLWFGGGASGASQNAGDKTVSWELFSEQFWSVYSHRK